jgi:predicted membrane-bound spermidine synthase
MNRGRVQRSAGGPALLLFLSGAAALIYQVVWIKQLSLVTGADVYAVTAGVSAFFAGLGLGEYFFGRRADRSPSPTRLYAKLEFLTAGAAILTSFALGHAAGPFAAIESQIGLAAWALPFALVGVPAFLSGGALPVLARAREPLTGELGTVLGRFFAASTAGGISGALLSTFLLIPAFGVRGTAIVAVLLNLGAAVGAWALSRSETAGAEAPAVSERLQWPADAHMALGLYVIAGGAALGYEVVWSQAFPQFASTRGFALSIVLAAYLAGLALGSAWFARRADRSRDPWGVFGLLIGAAGLVALAEFASVDSWLLTWQARAEAVFRSITGNELVAMCGRFALAAFVLVFVPTMLLGAAFPAVLRLIAGPGRITGRHIGLVVALNTAGGILGAVLTGFVFIPTLGLIGALELLAALAAAVGVYAVIDNAGKGLRWAVAIIATLTALLVAYAPKDRLARFLSRAQGGDVIFYRDGANETVEVIEQHAAGHRVRRLFVQGVSDSGDGMTFLRYMRMQSLLPLLVHNGEPRSALVIGFGTGITAGALLAYPGLNHRVCAELEPEVIKAASLFQGNLGAGIVPELEIRLRDGRHELLQNPDRYDLITLDPPQPTSVGVANLYSTDFYKLAARRLKPGGILAQWLPLPAQNDEDSRSLVRSFLDSFPYASAWTTEVREILLLGSQQPIRLDVPRISARFSMPPVRSALNEVGIGSPAALLATWVTGREGMEQYAGRVPIVTDDHPSIEYAAWVRRGEIARVLPKVISLIGTAPVVGGDDSFRSEMSREQENLRMLYQAELDAFRGDRAAWARDIGLVMKADPENAYYRWIESEP